MPEPVLLLGESIEISLGTIVGVLGGIATATLGGIKVLWSYWTNRDKERRKGWSDALNGKDRLIAEKDSALEELRKEKDAQIEELRKELSRKSDEHAAKIEELTGNTITKIEGWSSRLESVLDRNIKVQQDFADAVRHITSGGDRV